MFSVVPIRSRDVLKEIFLMSNAYASQVDKALFERKSFLGDRPVVWKGKTKHTGPLYVLVSNRREGVYTPV